MALDFDGSSQMYQWLDPVVASAPVTLACWFNLDSASSNQCLMSIMLRSSYSDGFYLYAMGTVAGDPIYAYTMDGGGQPFAKTTKGFIPGKWHHAAAVYASSTSRLVYIDGGFVGSSASSATPAAMTRTTIGATWFGNTDSDYTNGRIAEAGLWSAALTPVEVLALSRGAPPILVRPSKLASYVPMVSLGGRDRILPGTWTETGAPPASQHPRMPRQTRRVISTVAAPATTFGFLRDNAGLGVMGGGPFSRSNAGLGVLA